MAFSTPVTLIIFNRPDLTELVFSAIAQVKPRKLLVIADGPRFPEETEKCQKTRSVIEKVDWDCEVLTNFSEENLTSPIRCSSGLNWVFSEVEEAIILEDDCLPTQSFFYFCQELLERYRSDERVMHISGNNFQFGQQMTNYSYYFSRYAHSWGWASWRRAWRYFDLDMKTWPEFKAEYLLSSICEDPFEQKYWTGIFDRLWSKQSIHWDYAWLYSCWSQNGLSILPNSNLVSNTGFRPDGTRTKNENSFLAKIATNDIWTMQHPPLLIRHQKADSYTFDYIFGGNARKVKSTLVKRVLQKLSTTRQKLKALSR